jgi:hypothetical protein
VALATDVHLAEEQATFKAALDTMMMMMMMMIMMNDDCALLWRYTESLKCQQPAQQPC